VGGHGPLTLSPLAREHQDSYVRDIKLREGINVERPLVDDDGVVVFCFGSPAQCIL
jgi:hypothetical protein